MNTAAQLTHTLDWLFSTQLFGIKPGLEQTRILLQKASADIGDGVRVVHVAGTNGKGSTCAMIEAMAREAGLRTGLFTSPHLVRYQERIRINGQEVEEAVLLRQLLAVKYIAEQCTPHPTFFELTLATAIRCFKEHQVDIIILETGMGGRLDATNAIRKNVAVITPIGIDHTQYLGDSLADITSEKAGIIAACIPVITARQEDEALRVIQETAHSKKAPLQIISPTDDIPQPALSGPHQRENAAIACAAIDALGIALSSEQKKHALSHVVWEGRFEYDEQHQLILDGAHNIHAVKSLVATWKEKFGNKKTATIFAVSADKNMDGMFSLLHEIVAEWHLVPCLSPRIMQPQQLAETLRTYSTAPIVIHPSLQEALSGIHPSSSLPILVTGSLFLLGEVKALLQQHSMRSTMQ